MIKNINLFIPHLLLAVIVLVVTYVFRDWLISKDVNTNFILGANLALLILSLAGLFIQSRGATSTNHNAFLRGIYTSLLMKMFLIVGAILVYIIVIGGQINKAAILISMGLYIVYTGIEVIQLMKLVRKKSDV